MMMRRATAVSQMDNGGQQRSNGAPAQGAPSSGARGQRQQLAPPKQVNLQFLDESWERLLNAMERLEQVTEGFPQPQRHQARPARGPGPDRRGRTRRPHRGTPA